MKKRAIIILLILMSVVFTWTNCKKRASETDKIVVGYLPIIAHLPALIADQQGYFRDVNIEYKVFSSSNDMLSALQRGDIDISTTVAIAPVAQLTNKRIEKGLNPIIRLFSYSKTTIDSPFDAIFTDPERGINEVKQLEGKKIGAFPGTTAKNICSYYLKKIENVNIDDISWVGLPPNIQIDALKSGDIDALYTYEPTCTIARLSGLIELHGSVIATVLEGAPYGGSAVNRNFEKSNQDLIKKFINGFDKGILFTRENPVESRKILQMELGLPIDIAQKCNIEYRFSSKEIMEFENKERFKEFLKILVKMSEIPKTFNVDLLLEKSKND